MPNTPMGSRPSRINSLHRPSHYVAIGNAKQSQGDPSSVLFNPYFNKGSGFTVEEREKLGISCLLPPAVEDIQKQCRRAYRQFLSFSDDMARHIYLSTLRERNQILFYRLVIDHLQEMLPIIYTPVVGQGCLEFGLQFRQAEGMYLPYAYRGRVREVLDNWRHNNTDEVAIVVVTDGSRILGLGDLGACGMGIPIGKSSLYVAAGGFHPSTALPVLVDVGTNNENLLADEFYLGERHRRISNSEYYEMMEEVVMAIADKWPRCVLQFEDFSNDHCFNLLDAYRTKMLCFNDDIQGTGVVIAAGFLVALKITRADPFDQKIIFLGAGSAAVGVARQIAAAVARRFGGCPSDFFKCVYMVDSKGLVTTNRGDALPEFKVPFARRDFDRQIVDLEEIIREIKPTALIGLSGVSGTFTPAILKLMGDLNAQPIIFPLSNPTPKAECTAEDAYRCTDGRCVFASGSPFQSVTIDGKIFRPSQGNNLYAFPGIGFGAWLCGAREVSDDMLVAASLALADCVSQNELDLGLLFPPIDQIRRISATIAAAVISEAFKSQIATSDPPMFLEMPKLLVEWVKSQMFVPEYLEWQFE